MLLGGRLRERKWHGLHFLGFLLPKWASFQRRRKQREVHCPINLMGQRERGEGTGTHTLENEKVLSLLHISSPLHTQ
jgi:hypothetical protein